MPIRFYCEACTSRIKVPDGTEGKLVKCPGCGHAQRVPQEPADEPPESNAATQPAKARKTTKSAPAQAKSGKQKQASKPASATVSANDLNEVVSENEPGPDHDPVEESEELHGDSSSGDTENEELLQEDEVDSGDEIEDESEEVWNEEPADEAGNLLVGESEDELEQDAAVQHGSEDSQDITQRSDVSEGKAAYENESYSDEPYADDATPPDEIEQAEVWPAEEQADEAVADQEYPIATPVAHVRTSGSREFGGSRKRHDRDGTSSVSGASTLLIVGWLLRVLAIFSVAGVVKILLLMSDGGASVIDMLFVAPLLLGVVATFWAVGELSLSWCRQSRD